MKMLRKIWDEYHDEFIAFIAIIAGVLIASNLG